MPFQPGQSGNPFGRPKGVLTFAGLLRKKTQLAHLFIEKAEEEWPAIVKALFDLAAVGDLKAISLILDYSIAKMPQITDSREETEDPAKMTTPELIALIDRKQEHIIALFDPSMSKKWEEKDGAP